MDNVNHINFVECYAFQARQNKTRNGVCYNTDSECDVKCPYRSCGRTSADIKNSKSLPECEDSDAGHKADCITCLYANALSEYDSVRNPSHYCKGRQYEPRKVIEDWGLNFYLGNVVKYISRAGRKDSQIDDLKKAAQYLQWEIERLEKEDQNESIN